MRLIDADALDDEMYHKSFEVDDGRNVWNSGLWIRYKIFEEAIRDAPTVDAVPVRHGKWIYGENESGYDGYYCSKCFGHVRWYGKASEQSINFIKKYNYCPNCGAKMDEAKEE